MEKARDVHNKINAAPNIQAAIKVEPIKIRNMVITHKNKLETPRICMVLIRYNLFRKLKICPFKTVVGLSTYCLCKLRTTCVYATKRLVKASRISEMAENSRAGVVSVNASCIILDLKFNLKNGVFATHF